MSVNAHIRAFSHALQFLTRLPAPPIGVFDPADLSRSALWFPVIGALVGVIVAAALWAGALASPWIGALLALLAWVWVTGGMHLDGLGDVADALGAAHRSPERFIEVLRDPHIGAYGTMAIVLQLIAKLVLLAAIASPPALAAVVLIAAWARWGALVWGTFLPPLASGSGERFTWHIDQRGMVAEGVILAALSLWLAPLLLLAAGVIAGVAVYWKYRLGGITGDCLGAGIELTEAMLLLLIAVQMA
jgi:adenosylcobinamide-GDP ribazoletransferase